MSGSPCLRFPIGRTVDHEHLDRLLACRGELMLSTGGKVARIAGLHLAALAVELDGSAAFEEIADLLQVRMRMRRGARAFLDHAEEHLDVLRSHRLGADEAAVGGAGVVR